MADFQEFGSREFEGWTDTTIVSAYVTHFAPITDQIGEAILHDYIRPGTQVLDLCCGQGSLTAQLSKAGAKATGLDFSPAMVQLAKAAAPDATIVEGDATDLPFEDSQFDTVICNFGMMHIPDQPKALAEIARVLRPGGAFVMATWMAPPASPAFAAVFGALKAHADFSISPPQPDLFTFADPDQASAMMSAAGLDLISHSDLSAAWHLTDPGELFEIFHTGTVGAAMLIRSQSDDTVQKIFETVANTVRDTHAHGAGYRVPVNVALLVAQRPT